MAVLKDSCANQMNSVRMRSRPARITAALLACLFLAWPCSAWAEDPASVANKIKAAWLFNFTKYVEWPAGSFDSRVSPFVIGVIGKDPVAAEIETTLADKDVEGRPLSVRQLSEYSEGRKCHIVFICASERKRLVRILETLKGQAVLTVSDADGFIEEGGMIYLRREANTIKFDINQTAAEKAGLKISSKLLQLTRSGKGTPGAAK